MAEGDRGGLLTEERARVLASGYKSRPFWGGITPRWILRYLRAHDAFLPVDGGSYRVNVVDEDYLDVQTSVQGDTSILPREHLRVEHGHDEGTPMEGSFALYEAEPKQIFLRPIQTVVKVHTRVPVLYSAQHDQLHHQVRLAAEYVYETQENLFFDHPEYGLLNNVDPDYYLRDGSGPTPEVLDELLSRVWKEPDLFLMHPEALDAFRTEASQRSLNVPTVERCDGRSFSAWRGVPIFPTNKLFLTPKSAPRGEKGSPTPTYEMLKRKPSESTTKILALRAGEEKQGVVGLYAAKSPGSDRYPYLSVDPMGISDNSVASYLLSMFVGTAILTPDALACAEVTI